MNRTDRVWLTRFICSPILESGLLLNVLIKAEYM